MSSPENILDLLRESDGYRIERAKFFDEEGRSMTTIVADTDLMLAAADEIEKRDQQNQKLYEVLLGIMEHNIHQVEAETMSERFYHGYLWLKNLAREALEAPEENGGVSPEYLASIGAPDWMIERAGEE